MGNKISCTNCNGKPASVVATTHQPAVGASHMNVSGANPRYAPHSHYHHQGGSGAQVVSSNILTGRSNHILRLWAEVFHVSASSGAVRWNQVSDDLVPVTVSFINGRYHITAFNSRVEKVLDCWLQSNKLGQASSCFIYWKDNVSGDTWGLNFTSPADARAFRDCILSGTVQLQTGGGPKRAESSYSLRGGGGGGDQQTTTTNERVQQPSKAGSGAHLTTKYYSNRTAISQPNSPSKKRIQQHQQLQLHHHQQQQQQQHPTTSDLAYGSGGQSQQPQCTCDCLTAEMLHKQRNGRIRYANFTRQDSGGTTQSSRSDGSLVRRQHERQQQYYRAHQRSMDEHYRNRVCPTATATLPAGTSRSLGPASSSTHRRVQQTVPNQQQQRIQISSAHPNTAGGNVENYPTNIQNGGYIQIQHQKAIVHASGKQLQQQDISSAQQQDQHHHQQQQQYHQQQQSKVTISRPQSQAQGVQTQQLVSTATTTDDLLDQQQQQTIPKRSSQRPKSLVSAMSSIDMGASEKCRDRTHRSLEGRRRSLERMQCVDLTDASPTIPIRGSSGLDKDHQDDRPSAAQLEEYERELRRRLLHGGDSGQNDALETFETLLKESMDDVANLMREVQHELTLIRAEERRYQSQSTQSLHRISSANFADNVGGGIGSISRQATRSPVFDTMSIDGQLPFLPSFASSLANASSAYHNSYQSWDRLGGYLTSSEVSDDERASLTTAVSDDEDNLLINPTKPSFRSRGSSAVSFECLGSVRKSGFLSVKKWLIRKRHSLELARKRGWKGYWVCLKGTTLLFYSCDANIITNSNTNNPTGVGSSNDLTTISGGQKSGSGQTSSTSELTPKHLIFVDACLVQPVPEHPRRDNVFCLSTSFGDAYLFDATSLPERDQWIQVIHTACAAQIARNSGRCTISHFLIEEYQRLEAIVDEDCQSRQEAELLLTCCTEEKQKQQLVNHVLLLEEKIERNRIEIFRLKSYFAALTNDEGPNPKTLLSQASRRTKAQLNRIGVFTVSSLHAFNCAKNPQPLEKTLHRQNSFGSNTGGSTGSTTAIVIGSDPLVPIRDIYSPTTNTAVSATTGSTTPLPRVPVTVLLMTGEQRSIEVPNNWTSENILQEIFGPGPESREYFLRCSETGTILYRNDLVSNYSNHTLMITPKLLFTIDLVRESNENLFGFSVESELCQNNLRVFVMRVEPNSIAAMHGLCRHDEIMVINGALVQELDMMFVESILQEELTLCLMIRSSRLDVPSQGQAIIKSSSTDLAQQLFATQTQISGGMVVTTGAGSGITSGLGTSFENEKTSSVTDELIESLVCPPPPSTDFSQLILSDTQLSKYIVPKVDHFLPTSENLTSMNVIRQHDSSSSPLVVNFDDDDDYILTDQQPTNSMLINSPNDNQFQLLQQQQQPLSSSKPLLQDNILIDSHHLHGDDQIPSTLDTTMNNNIGTMITSGGGTTNLSTFPPPPPQLSTGTGQSMTTTTTSTIFLTSTSTLPATTSSNNNNNIAQIKHMEKLIRELLDTENNFCQSLQQLVTLYLEPLSQNNFLTATDIKVLFGSILKVIDAQNEFRSELTEVGEHILGDCQLLLERCNKINNQEENQPTVNELGVGYIADCFAKHSKNFRDYSTFCASHARAVKLMAQEKTAVHEWLQKQSNGQISQSLESYLIRPIQRVLKYPLLLGQMKVLCNKGTTNYNKLEDAIKDLEKVAEHINEMQRIQEEYGAIFEHLARNHTRMTGSNAPGGGQQQLGQNGIVDLSPPALKHSMCSVPVQRNDTPEETDADSQIDRCGNNSSSSIDTGDRSPSKSLSPERSTNDQRKRLQMGTDTVENECRQTIREDLSTSEERNEFLRVIRQIIREDVRRMNVNVNVGGSSTSSAIPGSKSGLRIIESKRNKLQSSIDPTKRLKSSTTTNTTAMKSSQQQHEHHHQHQRDDDNVHKVPCGLCGKEVALGHHQRQQSKQEHHQQPTNTSSRQDSSSTTSH